ncbi:hypothetical protein BKA70DRAFT_1099792 [Coprinopsis sp. MPI-PUGE-AT-0042]|nr:hypothetical protein BKA70DRAFT_1099792 [Coprinopsis sp. MPI-PUGE-AT-0042]
MSSLSPSTLTFVAQPSYDAQPPSNGPVATGTCPSPGLTSKSSPFSSNLLPTDPPFVQPGPFTLTSAPDTSLPNQSTTTSAHPTIPGAPQQRVPRAWQHLIRSDFWFADGNIILIAGNAIFKVHRGQLERQSEMFRDLFSVPQPELFGHHQHYQGIQQRHQDLIDGCHWVELHDRPSDVLYFLAALYDGLYFKSPRTSDFAAVSAVLRLSTKYLVEPLRLRCLARLELDWPTTLSGWDIRERSALDAQGRYLPREVCCHPILLMELAFSSELGLSHLLPAAFYDLSRYGPSKIMAGTFYEAVALDVATSGDPVRESGDRCVVLNREMLGRTFKGREKAQKYISDFVARELENRSPARGCAGRDGKDKEPSRNCLESFYFIMLNILRSVGGIACGRDADPLFTLVQATEMLSRTDFSDGHRTTGLKICHACKVDFAASVAKAREEVWSLLPVWFGLVSQSEKVLAGSGVDGPAGTRHPTDGTSLADATMS